MNTTINNNGDHANDAASTRPCSTPAIYNAIAKSDIEAALSAMLDEFDTLVPEQYEGYDRPYQPLAKRMDLFEKHVPFGEMVIYTEILPGSKTISHVYCRATLYLLTAEGYAPLFSRLGEGSLMTARTDGPVAEAETSAIRRILIAIGLSNDGGKDEFNVLNDNAERDNLSHYLTSEGKSLDALIKAHNAERQDSRIEDRPHASGATVSSLKATDVIKLRDYISKKSS